MRITGRSRPIAGKITAELLKRGLLAETTERGPLRAAFPASAAAFYFPKLYPENVEAESLERERLPDSRNL